MIISNTNGTVTSLNAMYAAALLLLPKEQFYIKANLIYSRLHNSMYFFPSASIPKIP